MKPIRSTTVQACLLVVAFVLPVFVRGQASGPSIHTETLKGLQLRGIGPAVMGGRIADIAISSKDPSTWYLGVGSGGVWKTQNSGTTWTPLFDQQGSYSVGCVALDPSNPETVWVGTGENVSGRHAGWGDGIYRSRDGGRNWERVGLERSERISKIVVDPRDGNVVLAAAEGPLWSSGGERGLYKTADGGETWTRILFIDEDTGITDLEMDPRHPDTLYAAAYQRRRSVWSFLAGGPGSGMHKSSDGGKTWRELTQGLPQGDMGKIGLAVSAASPDIVYATIEAGQAEKGFYRSLDRGETWERRNPYISGGTGPHYYQEIVASPHDADLVYQMDVFLHVTRDGGKSFQILGTGREKHSDNHALVIDPDNPRHLIAGSDGGLYETFDEGKHWRHTRNLPISQFYKLDVGNQSPFYDILGGAQDLGTLLGPSRTSNVEGIANRDWIVPLGADGYACAFDTEDQNILYMEWQTGRLYRWDRQTGEGLDIQPQPAPGDPPERWNWDAPLELSPHAPGRLYFGSQRVWRSDDRGNSWTPLSPDLTRDQNRYTLKMAGRVQSIDALYDNSAMSWYSTLTAITESPVREGVLYTGSDDGRIHVSQDGGGKWRPASPLPGVPALSFVNDLQASHHDARSAFAALDNHKEGDYRPFLLETQDAGRSWRSIVGDLPSRGIVWSVRQDHVLPDLLFAGTEFGLYWTPNRGQNWFKLSGGVPTISFRDLELQRRDDDLVAASFGRGFYILDDYSPLRDIARGALDSPAFLFPVRDAWSYVPSVPMQAAGKPSQGSTDFTAPNPPFGVVLTYYLRDEVETGRTRRRTSEKQLEEKGEDVPFPGWDRLREESLEDGSMVVLTVRNDAGEAIRLVEGPATPGIHRVSWDLRLPAPDPIDLEPVAFRPPWASDPRGPLAAPGRYRVEMALLSNGRTQTLGEARSFQVVAVSGDSQADLEMVAAFQDRTRALLREVSGASRQLGEIRTRLRHLKAALIRTPRADSTLRTGLEEARKTLDTLRLRLSGDSILSKWKEPSTPSILGRVRRVAGGHWETRRPPTRTQEDSLRTASEAFDVWQGDLSRYLNETLADLERSLEAAGAPWTPGRRP